MLVPSFKLRTGKYLFYSTVLAAPHLDPGRRPSPVNTFTVEIVWKSLIVTCTNQTVGQGQIIEILNISA